jgi:hypothetical protein
MGLQSRQMLRGAIAFVPVEAVNRVLFMHLSAQVVTVDFGQNGSRRNGGDQGITSHNGFCTDVKQRQSVAIDQHHVGLEAQAFYGSLHGQHGGLQDIETVNFFHTGLCNGKTQSLCPDFIKQPFTTLGRQFFGIIQTRYRLQFIQDHGRSHHRSSQGATTRFVYAGG